ncbi:MAG: hypothetical protein JXB39_14075 [Deltaproteobacteria bacterium]|nr:hypothetical protein [Deltaproteobacteria bacterium]
MRFKIVAWLLVLVIVGLLLALFIVQNQARVTDLSLNLGFGMWHLSSPASVPWLLLWTGLGGFLVGILVGFLARRGRSSPSGAPLPGGTDDVWT